MIVVIAILGLLAGLVMVRGPVRSARVELDATARALVEALQTARGQAIAGNRIVSVRTSAAGFVIDRRSAWRLAPGQAVTPAVVSFTPEGQSSGGVITVGAGESRVVVGVDWLTGRIWTDPAAL